MNGTIIGKWLLTDKVWKFKIEAPLIARERKAGQFIMLQVDEDKGERIPLTIADAHAEEGWICLIFQEVGYSTKTLAGMQIGETLPVLVGPLGQPTHIQNFGRVVCVGGGIGVAPLHPIVGALKQAGNHVTTIIGARTSDLLILHQEMKTLSDKLIVVTEDGTEGSKGRVTAPLLAVCESEPKPDLVVAIGPAIMMKYCSETTRPFGVKTLVSLNTIMVDGTGMCGGCRVTVGDEVRFVCVDGPEFDGHKVDFENMMKRLNAYREAERRTKDCNLEKVADEKLQESS